MKKLLLVSIVAALGACSETDDPASALAVSCERPVRSPDAASLDLAPAWARKFFDVDPKGVYTQRHPLDTRARAPRDIDLVRDLKLSAGDYVGLQSRGQWYYGDDTSPTGPTSYGLGAVFVDRQGRMLAPAPSGQEQRFRSPPTYWGNVDVDVPDDFQVPSDREVIVRVPAGAVKLRLAVIDSAYGDNSPVGEFGVVVFQPNRKSSEGAGATMASVPNDPLAAGDLFDELKLGQLAADPPQAKAFSGGPFAPAPGVASDAQWRGNYGGNGWKPQRSYYKAKRDSATHWGWDIFAPKGSALIAPVWPAELTVPPYSESYGHTVVLSFKSDRKVYRLAYAHLDRVEGASRTITGPEVVGYAGCTGSSVDQSGCGQRYESGPAKGTRNDHVHVGLFSAQVSNAVDKYACDPSGVLKWRIRS